MREKGTYRVVKGDATKPQKQCDNEVVIIAHVCNDISGWGAGFVLALNKAFGDLPRETYISDCRSSIPENNLRRVSYAAVDENDKTRLIIANMIAQHKFIDPEKNPRPLRYDALVQCMLGVAAYIEGLRMFEDLGPITIHCPKFGSALAGGNWEFIEKLIEDCWLSEGIDVTVYEYVG